MYGSVGGMSSLPSFYHALTLDFSIGLCRISVWVVLLMPRQSDGLEAVKLFDDKPVPHFDLIFMDIIMPRLDGVSATARIREWLPQAPIVAMTSNIRQEDVATYFQYGKF